MTPISIIAPLLTAAVILAFVAGFIYEAQRVWTSQTPPEENPALTKIWTGVSTLIGGVTAVVLNVKDSRRDYVGAVLGLDQASWITTCTLVYVLVGLAAVLVWVFRQKSTTTLIRNAATTFFGLVIPVVSAYLGYVTHWDMSARRERRGQLSGLRVRS